MLMKVWSRYMSIKPSVISAILNLIMVKKTVLEVKAVTLDGV